MPTTEIAEGRYQTLIKIEPTLDRNLTTFYLEVLPGWCGLAGGLRVGYFCPTVLSVALCCLPRDEAFFFNQENVTELQPPGGPAGTYGS
jgi:hypothetical protein